jgi:aspartyl-tRNA(Asn)/glutamyl-tRNA(Gln) amidotransferase subunit B
VIKTPIVEIKNLNSFRAVERSLRYEADRHYKEALQNPQWRFGAFFKETRGWDDARGITLAQRRKEEVADYRYFPEPDLVTVVVDDALLEKTRTEMGELPAAMRSRLVQQYGLSEYDASVITQQGRTFAGYFENVARLSGDAKAASNWVTNQVLASLNEKKIAIGDFSLAAETLAGLIQEVRAVGLNAQRAREVYGDVVETGCSVKEAITKRGFDKQIDDATLGEIVRKAVAANPKAVADYKKGKVKAADAIKGAVMKETKGLARMDVVVKLLMEELEKA